MAITRDRRLLTVSSAAAPVSRRVYDFHGAPSIDRDAFRLDCFPVWEDFIDAAEEKALAMFAHERLAELRYSSGHWDSVIERYREVMVPLESVPPAAAAVLERLASLLVDGGTLQPRVHLLDLENGRGHIDSHVDAVAECGRQVIGLCLLSPAVMRLRRMEAAALSPGTEALGGFAPDGSGGWLAEPGFGEAGATVDVLLPRRCAYTMRGVGRFGFGHAVLPTGATFRPAGEVVAMRRRVSVLLRDEPIPSLLEPAA